MPPMPFFLPVMLGGALGASLRYAVSLAGERANLTAFPWATLAVNLTGACAAGLLFAIIEARQPALSEGWRLFLGVGLLGGFTTFSAFSLETIRLVAEGRAAWAFLYILLSVGGGLALAFAGFVSGRVLA